MKTLKSYSIESKSAASMDKVIRLLAKFAELLDEDIMYYEELSPIIMEAFILILNDHTTVNNQIVMYL